MRRPIQQRRPDFFRIGQIQFIKITAVDLFTQLFYQFKGVLCYPFIPCRTLLFTFNTLIQLFNVCHNTVPFQIQFAFISRL